MDEPDEMKNFSVMHAFLRHWDRRANLQGNEQIAVVPCTISYFADGSLNHIDTKANIYVKSGKIEISQKRWLNTDDYYLGVDFKYQCLSLTESKALRVEGRGPRWPDPYWIEIAPKLPKK